MSARPEVVTEREGMALDLFTHSNQDIPEDELIETFFRMSSADRMFWLNIADAVKDRVAHALQNQKLNLDRRFDDPQSKVTIVTNRPDENLRKLQTRIRELESAIVKLALMVCREESPVETIRHTGRVM